MGSQNVVTDSLSRHHQVLGSEWTLSQDVVDYLLTFWPATVDLFTMALNYHLPVYFSPLDDPIAAGTDAILQQWDRLQAFAFPPFTDLKSTEQTPLLQGDPFHLASPLLPTERVVPRAPESGCGSSSDPSTSERSSQTITFSSPAPEPPCTSPSCVVTIQRYTRHLGLSGLVATQFSLSWRQSLLRLYQHHWECYRYWCTSRGHSVSSTVAKIAEFLCFLQLDKHLSVSTIRGYRFTLTAVFKSPSHGTYGQLCVKGPHSVLWVRAPLLSRSSAVLGLGKGTPVSGGSCLQTSNL